MLPRTDILINRIRQESDTVDANSLSDFVLTNYLNDGQRCIQKLIFDADRSNNVFVGRYKITNPNSSQVEFDLPNDIYAESSIISVNSITSDNRVMDKFRKSGIAERSSSRAYSIENRKIVFNLNLSRDVIIFYNRRLPLMGQRVGKIDSILGQVITMTTPILKDFHKTEEFVTSVDKLGNQIKTDLYIDDYSKPDLTVEGDLTDVVADQYIIAGQNATSHSCLPNECETYLKLYVQRKTLAHINSTKFSNASVFSQAERDDLIDLFEDKHSDIEYPFISDTDFLDY